MKKMGLILFLICMWASLAQASGYKGLLPGRSTKAEADTLFGAPTKEVVKGTLYDYAPGPHDAKRLSVTVDPKTQVVENINIYMDGDYYRDQLVQWFSLGSDADEARDAEGDLIEEFAAEGIALHHTGPDRKSPVKFMRYFSPTEGSVRSASSGNGTAYLGIQIVNHDGRGVKVLGSIHGSPAYQAGLNYGDIILQAGPAAFYQSGIRVESFADTVKSFPTGEPITFVIERDGQEFETDIVLERKDATQIETMFQENAKKAEESFARGREAARQKNFREAVYNYQQASAYAPHEVKYYKALGDIYGQIGELKMAADEYQKIVLIKADAEAYLSLGDIYVQMGQFKEALSSLKRAESLLPDAKNNIALFELMGMAYYGMEAYDDAVGAALRAHKLSRKKSQKANFYMAASFDRLGNTRDAIYYYNRFLKLRPGDEKREVYARRRISALKNDPQYQQQKEAARGAWMNAFGQVISGIQSVDPGSQPQTNPYGNNSSPNSSQQDSSWNDAWNDTQQGTSQYDHLFTLPAR